MQAQVEKTKGELIGEFRTRMVTTSVKEISPSGVRLEVNEEGEMKGRLNWSSIATVSVVYKSDGTFDWENKGLATTKEGDNVAYWGGGRGTSTGPMTGSMEGEVHYMTQSPRLSWLNNTTAIVEGIVDRVSREIQGRAYKK